MRKIIQSWKKQIEQINKKYELEISLYENQLSQWSSKEEYIKKQNEQHAAIESKKNPMKRKMQNQ